MSPIARRNGIARLYQVAHEGARQTPYLGPYCPNLGARAPRAEDERSEDEKENVRKSSILYCTKNEKRVVVCRRNAASSRSRYCFLLEGLFSYRAPHPSPFESMACRRHRVTSPASVSSVVSSVAAGPGSRAATPARFGSRAWTWSAAAACGGAARRRRCRRRCRPRTRPEGP